MTRVGQLKPTIDPIAAAEADHEGSKVSLRLSPLATFILEGGLQHRLKGSRTRVATALFEAAALDWLETQGLDPASEAFRATYLRWLTRQPISDEALIQDGLNPDGGPYFEPVVL
jgi:hypothetical protein